MSGTRTNPSVLEQGFEASLRIRTSAGRPTSPCVWTKYDGLIYVNEIIDCADRSVVGYCVSKRCRVEEAVWALEDACLKRFGVRRAAMLASRCAATTGSSSPRAFTAGYCARMDFSKSSSMRHTRAKRCRRSPSQDVQTRMRMAEPIRDDLKSDDRDRRLHRSVQQRATPLESGLSDAGGLAGSRRSSINDPHCPKIVGSLSALFRI